MSYEAKGIISKILSKESGQSKAGKDWVKQSFVIDTKDQYNPLLCLSMFGDDKVDQLAKFKQGQEVKVSFNVSSREYNGRYYTQVDGWKIEGASENKQPVSEPADLSQDNDNDGLPF
tara:strand:- start:1578 stop:1928 length:351 start_codon:yes stop_codon:yes gene_type:complete